MGSTVATPQSLPSVSEKKKKAHVNAQGWAPIPFVAQGRETCGVGIAVRPVGLLMSPCIKEYHSSSDRSGDIVAMIG